MSISHALVLRMSLTLTSSSAIFQSCCFCDEERKHKTNKGPFDFLPDSLCLCNGGKESNNNGQRWHAQHNSRIPIIIHNFGSTVCAPNNEQQFFY